MQRAYTAEQIADLASLMDKSDQYTEEQKSGMRALSGFLLTHSQCTYEELREAMKEIRFPENRKLYPPFREDMAGAQ